jgi:hypothetical protein
MALALFLASVLTPPVVTVEWSTASELNTAGFNVLRGDNPAGPFARLNAQIIPASPDPLVGGSYVFTDTAVAPGQTYYYQLEEVEFGGSTSPQGTVVVTRLAPRRSSRRRRGPGRRHRQAAVDRAPRRVPSPEDARCDALTIGPLQVIVHAAVPAVHAESAAYRALRCGRRCRTLSMQVTLPPALLRRWPFMFERGVRAHGGALQRRDRPGARRAHQRRRLTLRTIDYFVRAALALLASKRAAALPAAS